MPVAIPLSYSLHFSIFLTPRSPILFKEWQSIFPPPLPSLLLYFLAFYPLGPWMEEFSCVELVLGANSCALDFHTLSHLLHTTHSLLSPWGRWEMAAQGAGGLSSSRAHRCTNHHATERVHDHVAVHAPGLSMPLHLLAPGHKPPCSSCHGRKVSLTKGSTGMAEAPHEAELWGRRENLDSIQWGNWALERGLWPAWSPSSYGSCMTRSW